MSVLFQKKIMTVLQKSTEGGISIPSAEEKIKSKGDVEDSTGHGQA